MRLNLYIIRDDFADMDVKAALNSNMWEQKIAFATYTDGSGELHDDRIYVTEAEHLESVLERANCPIAVMCIGAPREDLLEGKRHDIAWTCADIEAHGLIERINELISSYTDWEWQLAEDFGRNKPLRVVARRAISLFGCPVWMWDAQLQVIFHVVDFETQILPKGYKLHVSDSPLPADEVNSIDDVFRHSLTLKEPYTLPPMFGYTSLCCNIFDGDTYIATIAVDGIDDRTFTDRDRILLAKFTGMVGQDLEWQPYFSKHTTIEMNTLYERMLNGEAVSASTFKAVLASRKWSIGDRYAVITVESTGGSYHDLILQPFIERIYDAVPQTLVALSKGALVVTVNRSLNTLPLTRICEDIAHMLKKASLNMSFGISTEYRDFMLTPYFRAQAHIGRNLGKRKAPDQTIYFANDNLFDAIKYRLMHNTIREVYYPAGLVALMEYDAANDTDLVETLGAFLRNGLSNSRTSAELFMHRNTLLNRLKKIGEIGGFDLDDKETRVVLELAYVLRDSEPIQ